MFHLAFRDAIEMRLLKAMKPLARRFIAALSLFAFIANAVDYQKEIKPILAENCYRCHGASQQKGGLRLDTAAAAKKGGEHGPALVSGDAKQSLISQTLRGTHAEISQMPYKKPPLDDARIALIEQWIQSGAAAPVDEAPESNVHWAFVPPKRPALPSVPKREWPRNEIDRFILARLEKESIAPAPEADRITLIRRASLDLIGLPPTPDEVDAFLNDTEPKAYER